MPSGLNLENYVTAWVDGGLGIAFLNNIIITTLSVLGIIVIGSLAAYAIVRWQGRAGRSAYRYFALGLIVPFQLGLPAVYKLSVQAGLVDTLAGVILVHIGAGLPLAIFLYSGFLLSIPLELEEAARVDGAGDLRTFVSIVFPPPPSRHRDGGHLLGDRSLERSDRLAVPPAISGQAPACPFAAQVHGGSTAATCR